MSWPIPSSGCLANSLSAAPQSASRPTGALLIASVAVSSNWPSVAQLSELQKFLASYASAAPQPAGRERPRRKAEPAPPPEPVAPESPVADYDDLEAEEVISLLGSLELSDLAALREYEAAGQGRDIVLRAIDGVIARREPAATR